MKNNILLIAFLLTSIFSYAEVSIWERNALIALYKSTNGANWKNNDNWNTSWGVYSWYGVTVTNIYGQDYVTKIDLTENNLSGSIPMGLGNLTELEFISFWLNDLSGTIPDDIGNLHKLKILSFEDNKLTGNIPNSFAGLVSMTSFWLNDNQLSGTIPEIFYFWPNLLHFSIGDDYNTPPYNNFSGEIDFSRNSKMIFYKLNHNNITFLNVKNRNNLKTTNKQFDVKDNPNLTCIIVDDKSFSTTNWGKIDATSKFLASQLECNSLNVDNVPIAEKNALISLYNSTNGANWTTSTNWNTTSTTNKLSSLNSVSSWYGITVKNISGEDHVTAIDLSFNNLSGSIPVELVNLSELEYISLGSNNLSGTIPSEIGNCTKLAALSLEDNKLTGNIPISFANLTSMKSFFLNDNQLSGTIPNIFTNWVNLTNFSIGDNYNISPYNNFNGELDFSNNSKMTFYKLNQNNINFLNIQNGNNYNASNLNFDTENNPNLACIIVDDKNYSTTSWGKVDATAKFLASQLECNSLSVDDWSFETNFQIYPNPATDILYFKTKREIAIKKIAITNLLGETIKETKAMNSIDISKLSTGIYLISIESTGGQRANYKIVKN